jgi:aconitate decarboxylase
MADSIHTQESTSEAHSSATRTLSTWVEDLTLTSVPDEIKTRVKHLILDGIGCALVGARLPWSAKARDAITKIEAPGRCTIFGWNQVWFELSTPLTQM